MCDHNMLYKEDKETLLWQEERDIYNYRCGECHKRLFVPENLMSFELDSVNRGMEIVVDRLLEIIEAKGKQGEFRYSKLETLANKIIEMVNK